MADVQYKDYIIQFRLYDGTTRNIPIRIPLGEKGEPFRYEDFTPEQLQKLTGKSAYDYATEAGFLGTEKDFAEKLAAGTVLYTKQTLTEEQKAQARENIGSVTLEEVLEQLRTPVFGTVDEENNIILTGALPDGTYTLKYEDSKGNLTEIGTLTQSSADSAYTNLADPSSDEWMAGYRLNSSGNIVAASETYLTNFIPCRMNDVIRLKGFNPGQCNANGTRAMTYFFGEDKSTIVAKMNALNTSYTPADGWTNDETNALWTHTVGASTYTSVNGNVSDIRYCRFTGELYNGYTEHDVIITVNQEIT